MSGSTVLLVEDDSDLRDAMQDLLEQDGYDVIPAANGKQAIEYLSAEQSHPPDAVVTDLMMPLVTGWQVLAHIRGDPALASTPVIVLTAITTDRPSGATVVFRKPFGVRQLVEALEQVLLLGHL